MTSWLWAWKDGTVPQDQLSKLAGDWTDIILSGLFFRDMTNLFSPPFIGQQGDHVFGKNVFIIHRGDESPSFKGCLEDCEIISNHRNSSGHGCGNGERPAAFVVG